VPDPVLVESNTDIFGSFETRWMCEPPPEDQLYQVFRDEWTDDMAVRTIWEWR